MKKDEVLELNIYLKVNNQVINLSNKEGFDKIVELVKNKEINEKQAKNIFKLLNKGLEELPGVYIEKYGK